MPARVVAILLGITLLLAAADVVVQRLSTPVHSYVRVILYSIAGGLLLLIALEDGRNLHFPAWLSWVAGAGFVATVYILMRDVIKWRTRRST